MENLCSIYRFIVLSPVPCLSRSIKRPGLPRMGLVTNGTRFFQRKFTIENFRIFLQMENAHYICYPGPRGFHLFFTAKFCDTNRFYYFCYRHEAVRALKR